MAFLMVLVLVAIVAAIAAVTTVVVMNAMGSGQRRGHLPPPTTPLPSLPPGLSTNSGYRLSAADRERIMVLLKAGKKIHAIKLYREVTGAGLREAKDAVEDMERYQ